MNWKNNNTLHKLPKTSTELGFGAGRRLGLCRVSVWEQVLCNGFSSLKFPKHFVKISSVLWRRCWNCKSTAETVCRVILFFVPSLHRTAPSRKSPDFFSASRKTKRLNPSKTTQQKHGILYKWSWKKMYHVVKYQVQSTHSGPPFGNDYLP